MTWGDEPVYTNEAPRITLGLARVTPPPGAFLQATRDGEAALQAAVAEATQGAKHIADLFCGVGTFALPLASTAPVHAVEAAPDLLEALDHAIRHTSGLKPITFEKRDLFRRPLLPDELAKFDAVVIDPPRAGAEAQTLEIIKARVPVICEQLSKGFIAAKLKHQETFFRGRFILRKSLIELLMRFFDFLIVFFHGLLQR